MIVPTAQQSAVAQSWQVAAVSLILDDLNADGFLDIFLKDISTVIARVVDQMLFAPGELLTSTPKGVTSVDMSMESFIEDIYEFYLDDEYFNDNMEIVRESYWEWQSDCYFVIDNGNWEWYCYYHPVHYTIEYETYPGIDGTAVSMWYALRDYDQGVAPYGAMLSIVETVLGTSVGSERYCAQRSLYYEEIDEDDTCPAVSISEALAAVRRSIAASAAGLDIQFGREAGEVYITAHRVWKYKSPFHMAIEYRDPVSFEASWLSAGPVFELSVVPIKLVSGLSTRQSDTPSANVTVAVVYSPLPAHQYFLFLIGQEALYNDCLSYWLFPESSPEIDYNSNGYVSGMIEASSGVPNFIGFGFESFSDFKGGATPVPAIEFTPQASACP